MFLSDPPAVSLRLRRPCAIGAWREHKTMRVATYRPRIERIPSAPRGRGHRFTLVAGRQAGPKAAAASPSQRLPRHRSPPLHCISPRPNCQRDAAHAGSPAPAAATSSEPDQPCQRFDEGVLTSWLHARSALVFWLGACSLEMLCAARSCSSAEPAGDSSKHSENCPAPPSTA